MEFYSRLPSGLNTISLPSLLFPLSFTEIMFTATMFQIYIRWTFQLNCRLFIFDKLWPNFQPILLYYPSFSHPFCLSTSSGFLFPCILAASRFWLLRILLSRPWKNSEQTWHWHELHGGSENEVAVALTIDHALLATIGEPVPFHLRDPIYIKYKAF